MDFLPFFYYFIFYFVLIDGVQASGVYCLGDDQLAGVIFGTIVATTAVLGALALAVLYFRGRKAKSSVKDVQLEAVGDEPNSQVNSRCATLVSDGNSQCAVCGCHKRQEGVDVTDHRTSKSPVSDQKGIPSQKNTTPLSRNLNKLPITGGSEYRRKKKRNSTIFGSWWTGRDSKHDHSHSTESLNSVSEIVRVDLKSRDTSGLGFNICGNLRDGIFVKSLSNRGPAKESGCIKEGDRILNLTIDFENIVFEDALTLISYASPYPVTLQLQRTEAGAESFNDSTPVGIGSFSRSDKDTTPSKCSRIICHPLFKSQSMEEIPNFQSVKVNSNSRSMKGTLYFHSTSPQDQHFDSDTHDQDQVPPDHYRLPSDHYRISSTQDRVSPDQNWIESIPSRQPCYLEIVEETPELPKKLPLIFNNDLHSITSSTSDIDTAGNIDQRSPSNTTTTITVTAEINAASHQHHQEESDQQPQGDESNQEEPCPHQKQEIDQQEEAPISPDPYAGLSYEDRLQIIRLSYEDTFSCTQTRSESQMTGTEGGLSVPASPKLGPQILSAGEIVRHNNSYDKGKPLCEVHDDEGTEDDALSVGESPSSLESSTAPDPIRPNTSFTSPSGSSIGVSSNESDHHNHHSHDDDCDIPVNDDTIEQEQYEKLLYFQRQLAKQHEELARLGIQLPPETEFIHKVMENDETREYN